MRSRPRSIGWPPRPPRTFEISRILNSALTSLEDKMIAIARSRQSEDELLLARRELDLQLRPYRGKMTAPQLAMLEKQYLERQLLESEGLPRLSLFYLR